MNPILCLRGTKAHSDALRLSVVVEWTGKKVQIEGLIKRC